MLSDIPEIRRVGLRVVIIQHIHFIQIQVGQFCQQGIQIGGTFQRDFRKRTAKSVAYVYQARIVFPQSFILGKVVIVVIFSRTVWLFFFCSFEKLGKHIPKRFHSFECWHDLPILFLFSLYKLQKGRASGLYIMFIQFPAGYKYGQFGGGQIDIGFFCHIICAYRQPIFRIYWITCIPNFHVMLIFLILL